MKKCLLPLLLLITLSALAQKNISINLTRPTDGEIVYDRVSFYPEFKLTNLGVPLTKSDTIYYTYMVDGDPLIDQNMNPIRWAYNLTGTLATNSSVDISAVPFGFGFAENNTVFNFCVVVKLAGDEGAAEADNTSCVDIRVYVNTALSEITNAAASLKVYPNPAEEVLNFFIDYDKALKVTLLDITGKQLEVSPFWLKQTSINVSNYYSGVYMYQISGENGEIIKTGKFAVN